MTRMGVTRLLVLALIVAGSAIGSLGGPLHVTVRAAGTAVAAGVDGIPWVSTVDPEPVGGAIEITIPKGIPALTVQPARLAAVWLRPAGAQSAIDMRPLLRCAEASAVTTRCALAGPWQDFELSLDCRNCESFEVAVRSRGASRRVVFWARPALHLDSGVVVRNGDKQVWQRAPRLFGQAMPGALRQSLAIIAPSALLALVLWALLARLDPTGPARLWPAVRRTLDGASGPWGLLVLSVLTTTWLAHVMFQYQEAVPNSQDSIAQWFQGKIFSRGMWVAPAPPFPEHFPMEWFRLWHAGWFSRYPLGWSALLAVGHLAGVPWLVPLLCGSGLIVATYALGTRLFGRNTGILAGALLALSPWFQMTSVNFMSHALAAVLCVCCVYLFVRAEGEESFTASATFGVCLGALLNVRPFDAALIALPLAAVALMRLTSVARSRRGRWLGCTAVMAAAFLVMVGVYLGWIYIRLGTLSDPYGGSLSTRFGTDLAELRALEFFWAELGLYARVALALPSWCIFTPALLALLLSPRRSTWLVLTCGVALPGGYLVYARSAGFLFYGPRFWYSSLPFFALLSAAGLAQALRHLAARPLALCAGVLVLVGLVFVAERAWLGAAIPQDGRFAFTPVRIGQIQSLFGIRGGQLNRLKRIDKPALIFFRPTGRRTEYLCVAENEPVLERGKIVLAKDLGEGKNHRLIERFPRRMILLLDAETGVVSDYCATYACPRKATAQN
jgi:hypothetical protein